MKTASAAIPLRNWRGIAAVTIILLVLFGCVNQKKVTRWNNEHARQAAEYAEKHFPCQPGDTTVISNFIDSAAYNQSIVELNESLDVLNEINDSLLYRLLNIDTSCKQYVSVISRLQKKAEDLQYQVKHVKPTVVTVEKVHTVIDSAKAVATRLMNDELVTENNDQEKQIIQWKGTARIRLWMLISSGLANLLLAFFLFKKKSNPITKL